MEAQICWILDGVVPTTPLHVVLSAPTKIRPCTVPPAYHRLVCWARSDPTNITREMSLKIHLNTQDFPPQQKSEEYLHQSWRVQNLNTLVPHMHRRAGMRTHMHTHTFLPHTDTKWKIKRKSTLLHKHLQATCTCSPVLLYSIYSTCTMQSVSTGLIRLCKRLTKHSVAVHPQSAKFKH